MRERLDKPYPMLRVVDATVPAAWTGPVHVWDIDKTYLDTRFSQFKHVARIPFEMGVDKRPVPGAVALLHALREGPDGRAHAPLHFVSASPRQLAPSIERRMLLDGVEWDSITFKDPVRLLLRGQTHQLTEQVAFKLSALLLLARQTPPEARFHLFGDDAEHDALVACLFADVLAGRLRGGALAHALRRAGCRPPYIERIVELAKELAPRDAVDAAWIRLERDPTGAWLERYPPSIHGYARAGALADAFAGRKLISPRSAARLRELGGQGTLLRGRAAVRERWTPDD